MLFVCLLGSWYDYSWSMINRNATSAINSSRFSGELIKPLYGSYCSVNIPSLVEDVLTSNRTTQLPQDVLQDLPHEYEKVVVFLIDGFGWSFFERFQDKYPFLKQFLGSKGVASQLTTQFPSTTSAHITSFHAGLPVGESGIFEWYYYDPAVDDIIMPLLYSFGGDADRETLAKAAVKPEAIFPQKTFYQTLGEKQIKSFVLQSAEYTNTTYSTYMFRGSTVCPYTTLDNALVTLREAMTQTSGKAYYFFYYSKIDSASHIYGPESKEFEAAVDEFFSGLESFFTTYMYGKYPQTLFLMTADHGHDAVTPERLTYLNKIYPEITEVVKRNKAGKLLVPGGSWRDFFLYVQENKLDETYKILKEKLSTVAHVFLTEQLLDEGIFGNPTNELLKRLSNIVILPFAGEAIWWHDETKYKTMFLGHHGGLTLQEATVPLLAMPLY